MSTTARVHTFDWLRGVAVVVMIQTHSLVLLLPSLERSPWFGRLQWLDGLVAPSFIFSAGFALALVQVRAASTAASRRAQRTKSLWRIGEVLLVASVVNAIWFRVLREPKWLARVDILHCIGLSLLVVLGVTAALSTRPAVLRWALLAVALAIFFVSPFTEAATGPWSAVLNTRAGAIDDTLGSPFPLFPWAGHAFLGASFGATVATMRAERDLWAWLLGLVGLGAALWLSQDFWRSLYPAHNVWVTNPSNAANRWTQVLLCVCLFRAIEVRWPRFASARPVTTLAAFGASSLSAYFFHEMLLFEHHVGVFSKLFRQRLDWLEYALVLVVLIAATWLCMRAWEPIDRRLRRALTRIPR